MRPKLAISLNASTVERRRELMPITRKYHLIDLSSTCCSAASMTAMPTRVGWFACWVNVIALNPGPGIAFETPSPERVAAFQEIVKRAVPCFIRKPRGRDIYAACGQLKRMAEGEVPAGKTT